MQWLNISIFIYTLSLVACANRQRFIRQTSCSLENEVLLHGKCYELLTQGPCEKHQWLVYLENHIPICEHPRCSPGFFFYKNGCVDVESYPCEDGKILYVDLHGRHFCDCIDGYFYHQETNACYQEYEQGPCTPPNYIRVDYNLEKSGCSYNPCGSKMKVFNEENGNCYRKNFEGGCSIELAFVNSTAFCPMLEIVNHGLFVTQKRKEKPKKTLKVAAQIRDSPKRGRCRAGLSFFKGKCVKSKKNPIFG